MHYVRVHSRTGGFSCAKTWRLLAFRLDAGTQCQWQVQQHICTVVSVAHIIEGVQTAVAAASKMQTLRLPASTGAPCRYSDGFCALSRVRITLAGQGEGINGLPPTCHTTGPVPGAQFGCRFAAWLPQRSQVSGPAPCYVLSSHQA